MLEPLAVVRLPCEVGPAPGPPNTTRLFRLSVLPLRSSVAAPPSALARVTSEAAAVAWLTPNWSVPWLTVVPPV